MNDLPNPVWRVDAEIDLKTIEPWEAALAIGKPIRLRALESSAADNCEIMPDLWRRKYYVGIDISANPAADVVLRSLRDATAAVCAECPLIESFRVSPYTVFPLDKMGGNLARPLITAFNHIQTDLMLEYAENGFRNSSLQWPFLIASTLLSMEAIGLDVEERGKTLDHHVETIGKFVEPAVRGALNGPDLTKISSALDPWTSSFEGLSIHWGRLEPLLEPALFAPLRSAGERMTAAAALHFKRESIGEWKMNYLETIHRRILHGIWLRFDANILKEFLCLHWLKNC